MSYCPWASRTVGSNRNQGGELRRVVRWEYRRGLRRGRHAWNSLEKWRRKSKGEEKRKARRKMAEGGRKKGGRAGGCGKEKHIVKLLHHFRWRALKLNAIHSFIHFGSIY